MWKFALIILVWAALIWAIRRKKEGFVVGWNGDIEYENLGPKPWERHPVHGTLPIDPLIKYPRAYYFELSNQHYTRALQKLFSSSACNRKKYSWGIDNNPEKEAPPPNIQAVYDKMLQFFSKKVASASNTELALPGDAGEPVQVVHDRWLRWTSATNAKNVYKIEAEVVLYRTAKHHGKHVFLSATIENDAISISEIQIVGVVPEDQIGMFPVIANNPFEVKSAKFDPENPYQVQPSIVLSKEDVDKEVARRQALQLSAFGSG